MTNTIEKVVVIGGGSYAKIVISILKKIESFEIVGYTDVKDQGKVLGVSYLGGDEVLRTLFEDSKVKSAVIGIGQLQNANIKKRVISELKTIGYQFPAIISPTAIVNEEVELGEGTIVRDNAVISASTKIGKFTIIGTSVSVSYDTLIGDFTNISLGSNIGIEISIGNEVLIGMGSTVMNYKKIVDNCFIGAGSMVIKDCLEPGLYFGTPAKKIKNIE
ncbi:NeuD/PglB/VioB family sugar acetyltransferase [Psychroserpens sp. AS72]|uniref:NeuD/PglB/VioB family sugar acetyltransferase n=1 Tax=Psychroserpens sp. AS72 TaxID=3135775 RepID=UPI003170FA1F